MELSVLERFRCILELLANASLFWIIDILIYWRNIVVRVVATHYQEWRHFSITLMTFCHNIQQLPSCVFSFFGFSAKNHMLLNFIIRTNSKLIFLFFFWNIFLKFNLRYIYSEGESSKEVRKISIGEQYFPYIEKKQLKCSPVKIFATLRDQYKVKMLQK